MDITEKYYQTLLRMKAHTEMQLAVINEEIAAIEKERTPPEPKKRRNLRTEREREIEQNMLAGVVRKASWLKKPKRKTKNQKP